MKQKSPSQKLPHLPVTTSSSLAHQASLYLPLTPSANAFTEKARCVHVMWAEIGTCNLFSSMLHSG